MGALQQGMHLCALESDGRALRIVFIVEVRGFGRGDDRVVLALQRVDPVGDADVFCIQPVARRRAVG